MTEVPPSLVFKPNDPTVLSCFLLSPGQAPHPLEPTHWTRDVCTWDTPRQLHSMAVSVMLALKHMFYQHIFPVMSVKEECRTHWRQTEQNPASKGSATTSTMELPNACGRHLRIGSDQSQGSLFPGRQNPKVSHFPLLPKMN